MKVYQNAYLRDTHRVHLMANIRIEQIMHIHLP